MESDSIKQIKKQVMIRLYERYEDQLNEKYADKREEIGREYSEYSAIEHSYTEEEIEKRRTAYIDRRIKQLKKKNLRKAIEDVIKKCFGLEDKAWEWKNFPKEQVEKFLYVMASLRFEDDRIIYHDKIETDRKIRNKFIFRDLEKCSLDIDFIKYCNYILEYSLNYMPLDRIMLENILEEEAYLLRIEQEGYMPESYILVLIESWYEYYLIPEARGKSVIELYNAIASCEEIIGSLFVRYYTYSKSEEICNAIKKFLCSMEKEIADFGLEKMLKLQEYKTKYDIFQEYVWRLMSQTTKRETDIRSDIYKELKKDLNEKISFDLVMEEDKCEQLRRLLEWYMEHNYSVYSLEELEAVKSRELYYEVYSDKRNKYKGMTAEVIANRILREEYHRSYHLADEVIFLLYKIRRGILRYRGIDYKEFFELKYSFNKLSEQIWDKSRQDNYNPSVLFETWYRVMKRWKQNVVGC